jgi:hypothetical protein
VGGKEEEEEEEEEEVALRENYYKSQILIYTRGRQPVQGAKLT